MTTTAGTIPIGVAPTVKPPVVITRAEWGWVIGVSLLVLLVSSLPMLVGYAVQTPDQRFMGTLYDQPDYFINLARVQLGARSEFRFRSIVTSEPHASEPILYYYIMLGAVGRLLGLSVTAIYEISRLLGGLVELALIYKFIARFVSEIGIRRLSFLLVSLASGLGWLLIFTPWFSRPNQSPMDFWLADGYLIFSLLGFSHFGWSLAALLAAFLAWLDYAEAPTVNRLLWLMAFGLLLSFIQIFEIVLLDAVILLDGLRRLYLARTRWKAFLAAGIGVGLLQLLAGLPFALALQTNPLVRVWADQVRPVMPPPQYLVEGYGLLWVLAGVGLVVAWHSRSQVLAFPAIWLVGVTFFIYIPNPFQYRLLLGLEVPLGLFAGLGFAKTICPWVLAHLPLRWQSPRVGWWLTALTLIALLPSTLYVISGNVLLAATHWQGAYVTGGQVAAIDWLQANAQRDEIVLAELKIGGALPGWIGQHTYFGHFGETINFSQKQQLVDQFFSTMPDPERRTLLRNNDIRYIYYGPDEKRLGNFDPTHESYLSMRYQSADTAIYAVVNP